jgi:hypothetical protein
VAVIDFSLYKIPATCDTCYVRILSAALFQYRYSFAEIRYCRQEEVRKGRTLPARVETVVIFLPDVWTCCPTRLDWQTTVAVYRSHLESKLLTASGDEDTSRADTKALLPFDLFFFSVVAHLLHVC